MALNGIDIASYQAGINLDAVPFDFVIVKATEGINYVNPYCSTWVEKALAMRKCVGIYHYINGVGATAEADYFYNNCYNWVGKVIFCLDWEQGGNSAWGNESYLKQMAQRLMDKTGIPPIIYVQQSRMSAVKPVANALNCGLWIAQYANMNATGYQSSPWNEGSYSCAIRQYSSCGRLSGYSGNLDLNKFYGDTVAWGKYANPNETSGSTNQPEVNDTPIAPVGELSVPEKAAQIMEHLCTHNAHGYSQPNRAGIGTGGDKGETITLSDGSTVAISSGDRDCSSAVIECYAAQGIDCGGASYTGNMKSCMTSTGNFEALPASTWQNPKRGDILLNSAKHTVLALGNGKVGSFSRSENHSIHGNRGDQDGGESVITSLYNGNWDCVLRYIGLNASTNGSSSSDSGSDSTQVEGFSGKYECQENGVNVRYAPSTSAQIDESRKFNKGDTIILDNWVYVADGYYWGRYNISDTEVRYIAIGEVEETLFEKISSSSYNVQITTNSLNVRSGPGTNYYITTTVHDGEVYTIVDESTGEGASKWGKLISGAGWISLDYVKKL